MKGCIGLARKALLIVTNLTSICDGEKEKIVKNDLYRRSQSPYKLRKLQHTTPFEKKSI